MGDQKTGIFYETHHAMDGWLKAVADGETSGCPCNGHTIQAIKIKAADPEEKIWYQVFYDGEGWTAPVANGEMCGTTGLSKPIQGLNIWADGAELSYRVHVDEWSNWLPGDHAIICKKGVQAIEIKLTASCRPPSPPQALLEKTGDTIIDRLNWLINASAAKTYLEIGVREGHTFLQVGASHKTGIDPYFQFDARPYENSSDVFLFEMTSDEFFKDYDKIAAPRYKNEIKYDVIYIDGMHQFEYAFRDFLNSLAHSHDRTIWVFDDTVPSDAWSADHDSTRINKYRKIMGNKAKHWHGDVFKVICLLHDFYPMFSYATCFDSGNPQTVVWKTKTAASRIPVWGCLSAFKHLSYFDMLDNYQIFNPIAANNLQRMLDCCFNYPESIITINDFIKGHVNN